MNVVNKQNLWFITLFSLILVLSVFYITMPGEELIKPVAAPKVKKIKATPTVAVKESNMITSLKAERDEKRSNQTNELQAKINNAKTTTVDKNKALEEIKVLNSYGGKEASFEEAINKIYKNNVFVEIAGNTVKVVTDCTKCTVKDANNIMRLIQKDYENRMIISVKFLG